MKSAAAGKKWGGVAGSAFFVIFADVMRKLFSRYALSAIVAPLLAVGCNDGVFIDDFLPEAPSVTVGPDDTSVTIRFEAGNWDILSVEGPTTSLRGDIYDAEGNLLYGNHPLYGDGLLRMTYDDGLLDFGIERQRLPYVADHPRRESARRTLGDADPRGERLRKRNGVGDVRPYREIPCRQCGLPLGRVRKLGQFDRVAGCLHDRQHRLVGTRFRGRVALPERENGRSFLAGRLQRSSGGDLRCAAARNRDSRHGGRPRRSSRSRRPASRGTTSSFRSPSPTTSR